MLENPIQPFLIYLIIINTLSAIIFLLDKRKARKNSKRISEKTLHTFEILGGVYIIIPLMYIVRHKNRKFSYYYISYINLILITILSYLILKI